MLTDNVFVTGGYAYVVGGYGLCVLDVSNPSSPREVSSLKLVGERLLGIHIDERYAYIACSSGTGYFAGLKVIDISNPENLEDMESYEFGSGSVRYVDTSSVYVAEGYAYVTDESGGLYIMDPSKPSSYSLESDSTDLDNAGFYYTPGHASGIYVAGSYAYVADRDAGLRVIDVSNSKKPREVGLCSDSNIGTALGVDVAGKYVYEVDFSKGFGGIRIIDISNPKDPIEVGSYRIIARQWSVENSIIYVSGNYVYVIDDEGGLYILKYTGKQ